MWVGWHHDLKENKDAVWGAVTIRPSGYQDNNYCSGFAVYPPPGVYIVFWGRRGKTLRTKLHTDKQSWDMISLASKKKRDGYIKIDVGKLNDVYPEFEEDLDWAVVEVKLSM